MAVVVGSEVAVCEDIHESAPERPGLPGRGRQGASGASGDGVGNDGRGVLGADTAPQRPRQAGIEFPTELVVVQRCASQLGVHHAEVGDTGGGAIACEFEAQSPAELLDGRLADHVRRTGESGSERSRGRHHDDVATPFDHFVDGRTDGIEYSGEVDVYDPIEGGGVDSAKSGRGRCHSGVRDNHVEPSCPFDHLLHGCTHAVPVADVGDQSRDALPSEYEFRCGKGGSVDVDQCDCCSAGVQCAGCGQSDAVAAAGDQDDFACDVVFSPLAG